MSSYFGEELNKKSYFKKDLDVIRGELTTTLKKIYGALRFVKNKIKWNDRLGKYKDKGVKIAYQEGAGNVADINLTLVNVLRELGVDANPVLVSTRSNGVPFFPTLDGFNYVVVAAEFGEKKILLDASEEYSLPNVLPSRALNWRGTLVRDNGTTEFIDLESSNVSKEEATLNYKISSDGLIEGMSRQKYENLSSINFRRRKALLDKDDLISNIEESNDDIEIINFKLTNKDNISKPILTTYTFEKEDGVEIIGDKMYLSPMLFNSLDENPFKIETREYPVDFGCPWRDKALVTLEIPDGYKIETLPKSVGVGLSDDMGKFVFKIKNIGKNVQISSVIEVNKGVVPANYYSELKEFYKQIVAKQTEKIVLTKI